MLGQRDPSLVCVNGPPADHGSIAAFERYRKAVTHTSAYVLFSGESVGEILLSGQSNLHALRTVFGDEVDRFKLCSILIDDMLARISRSVVIVAARISS